LSTYRYHLVLLPLPVYLFCRTRCLFCTVAAFHAVVSMRLRCYVLPLVYLRLLITALVTTIRSAVCYYYGYCCVTATTVRLLGYLLVVAHYAVPRYCVCLTHVHVTFACVYAFTPLVATHCAALRLNAFVLWTFAFCTCDYVPL